jgi:hypothetical protein
LPSTKQREYTTPEACEKFGAGKRIAYRTVVRRVQVLFGKDSRIRLVGGTYVAPQAFWEELFAQPAQRGRPPTGMPSDRALRDRRAHTSRLDKITG